MLTATAESIGMHLNRLPKHTPSLGVMLGDIGSPDNRSLAKALGVSERTVRDWKRKDAAPRPVMLALFWLTRCGQQWLDVELYNLNTMHANLARCFRLRNDELQQRIEQLIAIGEFGSANDPMHDTPSSSAKPAWTHQPRQNPQAEPVMSGALVQASHLATVTRPPSTPRNATP